MDLKWQVAIITIEVQESSTKRTEHLESYNFKKQKVDENVKLAIDDSVELRKCIEIVPGDGDEVLIEATPISSRSPTIIDYKIHKKGKKNYFKIIRADELQQRRLRSFEEYCQERFKKTKLVDDMDNLLFQTLKTMFEPHVEDIIWKFQQEAVKILWDHSRLQEGIELKRCLEIVPEDDDDVAIEATPLSLKSPTIVDYKNYREGKKSYLKIIRANGNSQNYLTFGTMPKETGIKYFLSGEIGTMMALGGSFMTSFEDIKSFLAMHTPSNDLIHTYSKK
nr:hypothetical protein [Tanacetum cinerariifolium]